MNVRVDNFTKIIVNWVDTVIIPKTDKSTMPNTYKNVIKYGLPAYLVYNFSSIDKSIKDWLSVLTNNSDTVNLEDLEKALTSVLEMNDGKICVNNLIPALSNINNIPAYDADIDDVKGLIEIAKGFVEDEHH